MQTERRVSVIEMTATGLLSLAMTALRLAPAKIATKDKTISLEEVSYHDNEKDCWVIIYDRVYDLTHFFDEHPGGGEILMEYAGRDASLAFRGVGHSAAAIRSLDRFLVGHLPEDECIFRKQGGISLAGIPL